MTAARGQRGAMLILSTAFALAACTVSPGSDPDEGAMDEKRDVEQGAPIKIGEDLYLKPVGRDADGCMMYTLFSNTKATDQAIYYRTHDGGFTRDKSAADCQ